MIETETGSSIYSVMIKLNKYFASKYEKMLIDKVTCYVLPDGQIITITGMISMDAIVVEYAENKEEADKGWLEDGDLFYLSDYESDDELIEAIMNEIEGNIKKGVI